MYYFVSLQKSLFFKIKRGPLVIFLLGFCTKSNILVGGRDVHLAGPRNTAKKAKRVKALGVFYFAKWAFEGHVCGSYILFVVCLSVILFVCVLSTANQACRFFHVLLEQNVTHCQ